MSKLFTTLYIDQKIKTESKVSFKKDYAAILAYKKSSQALDKDVVLKVGKRISKIKLDENKTRGGAGVTLTKYSSKFNYTEINSHSQSTFKISKIKTSKVAGLSQRQKLAGIVLGAKEVLIKIDKANGYDGQGKGAIKSCKGLKACLDYISRKGDVEVFSSEDKNILSLDECKLKAEIWTVDQGYNIDENSKHSLARKVIISMPEGTDLEIFKKSISSWCEDQLKNNGFSYLYAIHTDTPHPHAHIVVKATNELNQRFSPKKKDIQLYRESFAKKFNELSGKQIANATLRSQRGKTKKGQNIAQFYAMQKKRNNRNFDAIQRDADQDFQKYKKGEKIYRHKSMQKAEKTRNEVLRNAYDFITDLEQEGNVGLAKKAKQYYASIERYPENTQDKLLKDKINDYLREIEQTKQQEQNKFIATKSKLDRER